MVRRQLAMAGRGVSVPTSKVLFELGSHKMRYAPENSCLSSPGSLWLARAETPPPVSQCDDFADLSVALSASRPPQPLADIPAAAYVIDQKAIRPVGPRDIVALLRRHSGRGLPVDFDYAQQRQRGLILQLVCWRPIHSDDQFALPLWPWPEPPMKFEIGIIRTSVAPLGVDLDDAAEIKRARPGGQTQ